MIRGARTIAAIAAALLIDGQLAQCQMAGDIVIVGSFSGTHHQGKAADAFNQAFPGETRKLGN